MMKNLLIILLVFSVFVIACEKKAEKPDEEMQAVEKAEGKAETVAYQAVEVTHSGTITGKVTYAGVIPPKQKVTITKDVQICGEVEHYKEDMVVSQDKDLANVVVSIANIRKGKAMDALGQTFELNQKGCVFIPHVTIVPAGKELHIFNSDGILHNVHTYSEKNSPVNIAQPGFKKRITQVFKEPEIIRVACDVHNWMGAYIVVADHPYYAVTDEMGNFEVTGIPAGTYTIEYWQETLGKQTTEVTVPQGGAVEANFQFATGSGTGTN